MKGFGAFLITIALIVGLMGCGPAATPTQYSLTVSSTDGGSVTTPGQGTSGFTYDEGEVVDLVAVAEEGHYFVNWTGDVGTVANVKAAITTIVMNGDYSITANFGFEYTPMVAAGYYHTVGLKSDGRVVAVGINSYGECDVGQWTDIVQVGAGGAMNGAHTVGLESDGTVVAVGWSGYGQCNVGGWTDITQVSAGHGHTVGLRKDGTVLAVGDTLEGQCNVGGWTDITQLSAGYGHTMGVRSDGTVAAVGWTGYGQCNVGGWTDIIQIAAGRLHTVGLRSDGSVVAVGDNEFGQCSVGDWTDIVGVAAGGYHTVGLRSDGSVVAVGAYSPRPTWNLKRRL
jgi:alpha-tubulin suppressor-like RCC1 family protein